MESCVRGCATRGENGQARERRAHGDAERAHLRLLELVEFGEGEGADEEEEEEAGGRQKLRQPRHERQPAHALGGGRRVLRVCEREAEVERLVDACSERGEVGQYFGLADPRGGRSGARDGSR